MPALRSGPLSTPCRFRYARIIVSLSRSSPRTNLKMHRTTTSSGDFRAALQAVNKGQSHHVGTFPSVRKTG